MTGHPKGERGAALLTVLLLVAVMAVIAATALDRLTLATRIAGSASTVDQGRAYAFAAEQIALRRVSSLVSRDPTRLTLDLGYKAVVAADAAATRDLPDPMGGVIGADALHRAALAELADRLAIVAKVDEIPGR